MDAPTDLTDPFYNRLKGEVLDILTGPVSSNNAGPERAMSIITAHCRAEKGFSQDFVRSLSAWKNKYGTETKDAPIATDGEQSYGNNDADKAIHSMGTNTPAGVVKIDPSKK